MADLAKDVKIELHFEEDVKALAEQQFGFLPETANKEAVVKALVKSLCNQ